MFVYEKKLQYPVRIQNPNPRLASVILSQYGGPDGELGASLRYLSQRYSMPYPELKALLTDIGTETSRLHTGILRENRTASFINWIVRSFFTDLLRRISAEWLMQRDTKRIIM